MNETLTVKDFGPIREATVEFKRVTVFIGPTGGGKSTLAKLAAMWRDASHMDQMNGTETFLKDFGLSDYESNSTSIDWIAANGGSFHWNKLEKSSSDERLTSLENASSVSLSDDLVTELISNFRKRVNDFNWDKEVVEAVYDDKNARLIAAKLLADVLRKSRFPSVPMYVSAERVFYGAVSFSLAGLMRDDINLPKPLLSFVNAFSGAKKDVTDLELPLFGVKYEQRDGFDYIRIPGREKPLYLYETASGIQSVAPLLVLLEHLSRQTERPQSFIIEEPELNLFPEAQQALLNVLIEKCAKADGKNDLIITTHSPYLLSQLNLLLYASQVAKNHPERAEEIKKMVPEAGWIQPGDLAVYHVGDGGVRSLLDPETGLIAQTELDGTAGKQADAFDWLLDVNSGF